MKNIPFNVSARTARLIGRENVSSAEGALIELVKNSYDADAKNCIVFFDDKYSEIPKMLASEEFKKFTNFLTKEDMLGLEECFLYDADRAEYLFIEHLYKEKYDASQRGLIEKNLLDAVSIYIADDGVGMTQEIIENSWMTIGTNNKNLDFISSIMGRVKSGAKGIGRFALDRLGEECDLLTKTSESDETLLWQVNWGDLIRSAQRLTV